MYGRASKSVADFPINSCMRCAFLFPLVKLDVFSRQIRGINPRAAPPQIEMDVQIEFGPIDNRLETRETSHGLPFLQGPNNFLLPGPRVTHVNFFLSHFGRRITERI